MKAGSEIAVDLEDKYWMRAALKTRGFTYIQRFIPESGLQATQAEISMLSPGSPGFFTPQIAHPRPAG